MTDEAKALLVELIAASQKVRVIIRRLRDEYPAAYAEFNTWYAEHGSRDSVLESLEEGAQFFLRQ